MRGLRLPDLLQRFEKASEGLWSDERIQDLADQHILFTDIGVHFVTGVCSHAFSTLADPSLEDPYILFEDIESDMCASRGVAVSAGSSSALPSERIPPSHSVPRLAQRTVCELFSLLPFISWRTDRERQEYLQQGQCVTATPTKKSGDSADVLSADVAMDVVDAPIDYPGCCLLLSLICMSVNKYLEQLECGNVSGKIETYASDEYLSSMTRLFIKATAAIEASKYRGVNSHSFMAGPIASPVLSNAERLCVLYKHIECLLLSTPSACVALTAAQVATTLSGGTLLSHRLPAVMWYLVKTLHEHNADSIFPQVPKKRGLGDSIGASTGEACGLLSTHFRTYVSSILAYSDLDTCAENGLDVDSRIAKSCNALIHSAYASCLRPLAIQDVVLMSEHEQYSTFRLFWCLWWHGEDHGDGRVYGTYLTLLGALARLRASSSTEIRRPPKVINTRKSKSSKLPVIPTVDTESLFAKVANDMFARHSRTASAVRRITSSNAAQYFSFTLSYLPLLLVNVYPLETSGDSACSEELWREKYDQYVAMGPYRPAVHILQTMTFAMMEYSRILSTPALQLKTDLALIGHVIKTCKLFLLAIDVAIQRAISWRSSEFSSQDELNSYEPDWTSVEFLRPLFESSMMCIREVCKLSDVVSKELLSSRRGVTVSRSLARSAPQLKVHADRARTKVMRCALAHNLSGVVGRDAASETSHDNEDLDWINVLLTRAIFYDSNCTDQLSTQPPSTAWTAKEAVPMLSSQKALRDATFFLASRNEERDNDSETHRDSFFVESTGGNGWGEGSIDDEGEEAENESSGSCYDDEGEQDWNDSEGDDVVMAGGDHGDLDFIE